MKNKKKYQEYPSKVPVYEDASPDMFLFPWEFMRGSASVNECTGLMQTIPTEPEELAAYESIYSYHQPKVLPEMENPPAK
ncbi:MAG: hypothetical protein IKW60_06485 [Clostridia bacterium]|nr:hypothetical protein [Clostridia bacterium]